MMLPGGALEISRFWGEFFMNATGNATGGDAVDPCAPVRLLHLSDLHIGKRLHDFDRTAEYEALRQDLIREAELLRPHGILISGDVFDGVNPSIDGEMFFGRLLQSLHQAAPEADLIITAGNHDSPRKIDSIAGYTSSFCDRIFLVGTLPLSRDPGSGESVLQLCRMLRPVKDGNGQIRCYVAAVPFVPGHVLFSMPMFAGCQDLSYSAALGRLYQELLRCALDQVEKLPYPVPVVAMGHCFVRKSKLEEGEKDKANDIVGGAQAVDAEIFSGYDYTALGHIHLQQNVTDRIRYSGSPFPVNFGEIDYKNGVTAVELGCSREADGCFSLRALRHIPLTRSVQFIRIPEKGFGSEKQIRDRLAELPEIPDPGRRPFCRIYVRYDPNDSEYRSLTEFRSALNELTDTLQSQGHFRFCGAELETVSTGGGTEPGAMLADLRDVPDPRTLIMGLIRECNGDREMDEDMRLALEEILQAVQGTSQEPETGNRQTGGQS